MLPDDKQQLLDQLISRLAAIPGVRAIVLGGSYARGTHHSGSDLDIALYYREEHPFTIEAIRQVAGEISGQGVPAVTDFYGWGAWVNGGAWIHTRAGKVDFLYRNLDQVERTIEQAHQGIWQHDYGQQPAYGFFSVIYLGETQVCRPLFDPHGEIARLKARVTPYPPLLRSNIINDSLWMAEFSLQHAGGYACKGDAFTTVGALARVAAYLTQALFAINQVYFINDKTALTEISAFPLVPEGYARRLTEILSQAGTDTETLRRSVLAMRSLWEDVVRLVEGEETIDLRSQ
jgi:hypothetical protein